MFQPLYQWPFPLLQFPSIITDLHGNILVWYLPGLMSRRLQVRLVLIIAINKLRTHTVGPMAYI
jgi:hypothetical protein